MKNYYEILNVHRYADEDEIRRCYHSSLEMAEGMQESEEKEDTIQNIKEAYFILSNDYLRREYNKGLVNLIKTDQELIVEKIEDLKMDEKELKEKLRHDSHLILLSTAYITAQIGILVVALKWNPIELEEALVKTIVLCLDAFSILGMAAIGFYKDVLEIVKRYVTHRTNVNNIDDEIALLKSELKGDNLNNVR